MASSKTYYRCHGTTLRSTEKAVHFEVISVDTIKLDSPKTEWFPISQINASFTDPNNTGEDYIDVAEWLLSTKGLI